MQGILGVLLLILGTNAYTYLPYVTARKLEGKWYLSGTASGVGWIDDPKWIEKASVHIVTPTADGGLEVKSSIPIAKGSENIPCKKIHNTLKGTKSSGTFTFYSSYNQALTEVTFLDVCYNEYFIIQNKRTINEKVILDVKLYTRKPIPRSKVMKKFQHFALGLWFPQNRILFLSYRGECV